MSNVIICVGIPASGKSTWASTHTFKNETIIICRDEVRIKLGLVHGENEELVTFVEYDKIEEAIGYGFDVVVADTNIHPRFRKALMVFCIKLGATVEPKLFPISLDEAIRRDKNREASVGVEVITRMHKSLVSQNLAV